MRKIFSFENNELIITDDETRLIPEFSAIIRRDNGSKGDFDGRKKAVAFLELSYIYFFADYRSPYVDLPEKERTEAIIKLLKLDRVEAHRFKHWKPDNIVNDAISRYRQLQDTPAVRAYLHLKQALLKSEKVADVIHHQTDLFLKQIDETMKSSATPADALKLVSDAEVVMNLNNKVVMLVKQIQETVTQIEKAEEKIKKDISDSSKIRGGGELGSREDPD